MKNKFALLNFIEGKSLPQQNLFYRNFIINKFFNKNYLYFNREYDNPYIYNNTNNNDDNLHYTYIIIKSRHITRVVILLLYFLKYNLFLFYYINKEDLDG